MKTIKTICVRKTGEYPGYCREYFEAENGGTYARQMVKPGAYEWLTVTNEGEPDTPLHEINFVIKA